MDADGAGFEAFVAARYGSLLRAAFLLTGDRQLAEDLVQSALMRCHPAWKHSAPAHPEAYVRTAMVRLATRGRRRLWRGEVSVEALPDVPSQDEASAATDALLVQRALAGLSVQHRAVVVLRYLYGLPEAECAAVLRCSVGTVKSRSSRALAALRASGLLDDVEVLP